MTCGSWNRFRRSWYDVTTELNRVRVSVSMVVGQRTRNEGQGVRTLAQERTGHDESCLADKRSGYQQEERSHYRKCQRELTSYESFAMSDFAMRS
jgi:hypothetical protein